MTEVDIPHKYKNYVLLAGETLQDERVNGGAFIGTDGLQFPQKLIPVSSHLIHLAYLVILYAFVFALKNIQKLMHSYVFFPS